MLTSKLITCTCFGCLILSAAVSQVSAAKQWTMGTPIVGYYGGPGHGSPLTEERAKQLADGGWNIVWADEKGLDLARKFGLRVNLQIPGDALPLGNPDDAEALARLDALIDRVKDHPAMYCYWIIDEPGAGRFEAIGKVIDHIRKRDPAHFAWVNLFPTYANNEQLQNTGDTVTAYNEHLRQFVEKVQPGLISYDHYHFRVDGTDGDQYFLNLELIRKKAFEAGVPFLNIIQTCTWNLATMRVPNGDELRWLNYTSLAYGAHAVAHYVYYYPTDHHGMMLDHEGKTTPLYDAAKSINREFASIAAQLQPLRSIGAYHTGAVPLGASKLADDAPFKLDPLADGFVLGYFGTPGEDGKIKPTHVMVVNLDYKNKVTATVVGPGRLDAFDTKSGKWGFAGNRRASLNLPPGGGVLLRARR